MYAHSCLIIFVIIMVVNVSVDQTVIIYHFHDIFIMAHHKSGLFGQYYT